MQYIVSLVAAIFFSRFAKPIASSMAMFPLKTTDTDILGTSRQRRCLSMYARSRSASAAVKPFPSSSALTAPPPGPAARPQGPAPPWRQTDSRITSQQHRTCIARPPKPWVGYVNVPSSPTAMYKWRVFWHDAGATILTLRLAATG